MTQLPLHFQEEIRRLARCHDIAQTSCAVGFAKDLERVLVYSDLTEEYCDLLTLELGATTPVSHSFNEEELQRLLKEGIGWLPEEMLAQVAVDRGAISALHDLVMDVWPDYWYRVAATDQAPPAEPQSKSGMVTGDQNWSHLMALDGGSQEDSSGLPANLDQVITIPPEQVCWLSAAPKELRLTVAAVSESVLQFRVSPLVLGRQVVASAILLDSHASKIVVVERVGTSWKVQLPDQFTPAFFVAEYLAPTWDVMIAVSLLSLPVTRLELKDAWGCLIREVERVDMDRARKLSEAVAATQGDVT